MKKMYAIKAPSGALLVDTTASNRALAWDFAYRKYLYSPYAWYADPTRAARRNGWRCVEVKVTE